MLEESSGDVIKRLRHWSTGEEQAPGELLPLIYLRLMGSPPPELRTRLHFIAVATRAKPP
jgi:hypothetical protein